MSSKQMNTFSHSHPENTPGLTKLWNRGYGTNRLDAEIGRAQSDPAHRFSLVLIQFDGLDSATDQLGHISTDSVWKRVLGVLTGDLGEKDFCCRLGGDEFLLILPNRTESECRALAERLRRDWTSAPRTLEGSLEMSVGIASYSEAASTVKGMFCAVDEDMFADKDRSQSLQAAAAALALPAMTRRTPAQAQRPLSQVFA